MDEAGGRGRAQKGRLEREVVKGLWHKPMGLVPYPLAKGTVWHVSSSL